MQTKDITTLQVLDAVAEYREQLRGWMGDQLRGGAQRQTAQQATVTRPVFALHANTGAPLKVCERAIDREIRRGFIDWGTSPYIGWLTASGFAERVRLRGDAT